MNERAEASSSTNPKESGEQQCGQDGGRNTQVCRLMYFGASDTLEGGF